MTEEHSAVSTEQLAAWEEEKARLAAAQSQDAASVSQPYGDPSAGEASGHSSGYTPHDDRPGNTSDGADFGYDPSQDLSQMKSYAFAQDPAKMLKGKPGTVQTNVFVLRQVQREVTYALTEKGLDSLPVKEADFLIVIDLGQKTTAWYSASPMILPFTYNDYFSQWQQPLAFADQARILLRPNPWRRRPFLQENDHQGRERGRLNRLS